MIYTSNSKELTVDSGTIVEIHKKCKISGIHNINVPYKIVCDLKDIPKENHSIVVRTLQII